MAKLLIDKGVDVNANDVWNNSPLMLAAERGYLEKVKLLLNKGADITKLDTMILRNILKDLALEKAVQEPFVKAFKYYLEIETDPYLKQEVINYLYKVEDYKLLEKLVNPEYKLIPLENKVPSKLAYDLKNSPNNMKYTAIVNILRSTRIALPKELVHLINDIVTKNHYLLLKKN